MSRITPVQALFLGFLLLVVLFQLGFFREPLGIVLWAVAVVVAITVHEFNHAFVAVKLGDPTPRQMGRVTLNPLRHLDPIGTLMLLVARFGWGKPVQFNPYNLRMDPALGSALVSAAGPAANLVTAFIVARVLDIMPGMGILVTTLLLAIIQVNIILAVFNLLPIPPLDGFGVLTGVAPKPLARTLAPLQNYGPLILVGVIALPFLGGPNVVGTVMIPIVRSLERLMLG